MQKIREIIFPPKEIFFFFGNRENCIHHYALHHIILKSNKNCHFKRVDTVAKTLGKTFYFRGVTNDKYHELETWDSGFWKWNAMVKSNGLKTFPNPEIKYRSNYIFSKFD